jgi:beta-phosphoglucomutase-like phosphatase (HAD superfamily)
MIKTIIFDLDGVLVEAKEIHYESLNKALGNYSITWDEHLSIYDGLKTNQKLEMLHKNKGLPKELFQENINDVKELLDNCVLVEKYRPKTLDDVLLEPDIKEKFASYIENKDLEAGLKYYLKAISASQNEFSKLWWSKKAARVYEKKNEWNNALDIYTSLKEEFPESDELMEIEKYIARAKAKTDNY